MSSREQRLFHRQSQATWSVIVQLDSSTLSAHARMPMGATDARAPAGFAPIAIGLGLTLIHLISIPVTNTSVNPARSTGVALFAETAALSQLWLFWLAPVVSGVLGGFVYRAIFAVKTD
jgi:aquaporin Z